MNRRGPSLRDTDENLHLFAKNRRTISVASTDDSDVLSMKLGKLSVGSAKLVKSGMDDLLSSTDGGKNDYDWLLTPPGTPLFRSTSDGSECHQILGAPTPTMRSSLLVKTKSAATKASSRLSLTQSENNPPSSRPIRSRSVTRPSISSSSTQYNNYSLNKSSSILNTSSASVSSYLRPSSPVTRSSSSTGRPSTPTARPVPSRPTIPSSSSTDKPRPSQSPRPSTPTSRPQIPARLSSPAARSNSRPSTPTSRPQISANMSSPAATRSNSRPTTPIRRSQTPASTDHLVSSNGRSPAPGSRPSSPGPRVRPQPVLLPDFPHDTPPNLRTTLPDRPLSASRSRPSTAISMKGTTENPSSGTLSRRQSSSPIMTRGRLPGLSGPEIRKSTTHVSEAATRKPVKSSTVVTESTGFGRTISKNSLDMAIRHMDIKNGGGSSAMRTLSGSSGLFPQSIRSAISKSSNVRALEDPETGMDEKNGRIICANLSSDDIYESSRYDAILLKEDLKNTNWLHSGGVNDDQEVIFDNGFESMLLEPFSP